MFSDVKMRGQFEGRAAELRKSLDYWIARASARLDQRGACLARAEIEFCQLRAIEHALDRWPEAHPRLMEKLFQYGEQRAESVAAERVKITAAVGENRSAR